MKKVALFAAFIIAAGLSFLITRIISRDKPEERMAEVISSEPTKTTIDIEDIIETTDDIIETPSSAPESSEPVLDDGIVLRATKPISENDFFSFKASFDGDVSESCHFELWSGNQSVQRSDDGNFVNIAPISGGKYRLCLVGNETGKNIKAITVRGFNLEAPTPDPIPVSQKIVLKASKPEKIKNKFSFKASFVGDVTEAYHYELYGNSVILKSSDGSFTDVPPVAGGRYKLCLVSEQTGQNLAAPIYVTGFIDNQKRLISEADFQARMLNKSDHSLDGGKKSFVTKGFRVSVVNADATKDGDFQVSDVQDVRDMIYSYNKWKGARVVELEYDTKGYVTLARIEPVY